MSAIWNKIDLVVNGWDGEQIWFDIDGFKGSANVSKNASEITEIELHSLRYQLRENYDRALTSVLRDWLHKELAAKN